MDSQCEISLQNYYICSHYNLIRMLSFFNRFSRFIKHMGYAMTMKNKIIAITATASLILFMVSKGVSGSTDDPPVSPIKEVAGVSGEEKTYVGTKVCLSCHQDKASFLETGHNFKVTKVQDGKAPKYPFTSIEGSLAALQGIENSLGKPKSFEDVSYVIGGYRRSVMFVDKEGFVFTGKAIVQLPAEGEKYDPHSTVPFLEGKGPDALPFAYCGRCHTTGWKDYTSEEGDNRNLHRQDNLPGMGGTFNQTGIQCEACHGAGGAHAKAATANNITKLTSGRTSEDLRADDMGYGKPVACGECHSKDGERRYPTYTSPYNAKFGGDSLGGRTKEYMTGSRLTADAILGVDPDTGVAMGKKKDFKCTTCHNPHMSTHNRDKPGHENALVKNCTDCHYMKFADAADGGGSEGHELEATCTDCHMPNQYHVFKINLSSKSDNAEHLSKDGKFYQPWLTAKMSCSGCHDDYDEVAAQIKKIHGSLAFP